MNDNIDIIQKKMTKRLRYRKPLIIIEKILVIIPAISLFILLLYYCLYDLASLPAAILVPLSGFFLLTVIRADINAKRPYEIYGFEPVIPKNTEGHSFPSRHVFSIFMIAVCISRVNKPLGILMYILGFLLAYIRVFSGVHFFKDVFTGAASAVIYGELLFYIYQ
ncbi:MAG: phosphatase PAP2 family protein [Lachnospiraceae bacterium]|nr:phosphatase PAP2 family protein [Lachnospiraceae bacterium]